MTAVEILEGFIRKHKIPLMSGFITFMTGIFVHLYVSTNKFFNYFEMGNIFSTMSYDQNDTLGLGRWFLPAATNLLTEYSMPLWNSCMVMLYISISAGLICELLGIRKLLTRSLFGMVCVTFPGMASILSFGVNSDVFALAILLAVLAVYAEEKWRGGMGTGAVLLCLSIGTYQPYLAVAVGVAFCVLLLQLLESYERKRFWKKVGRLFLTLLFGFVLYYIVLQVILKLNNTVLSDYHGVDDMTSFTPKGIAKGLVYTYGYFLSYFFSRNYLLTGGRIACNVLGAVLLFAALWKKGKVKTERNNRERGLLLLLMTALIPLGVNAAPFLMADRVGSGVDIYMMFGMMLLWGIFIRLILEESLQKYFHRARTGQGLQWCALLVLCVTVLSGSLICNQAYHRMDAMTQTTSALLERMVARMESVPEWNKDMPVYFKNPRELVNSNYDIEIPAYEKMKKLPGTEIWPNYNEDAIERYCEVYLHFPIELASEDQKEKLDQNETVQNMPAFPAQESIQVIDGVMVVKISEKDK